MNQQSVLSQSSHQTGRGLNMNSCRSSATNIGRAYTAPSSPDGWWALDNSSFVRSQHSPGQSHYSAQRPSSYVDSPLDSPYIQSPPVDASFASLPYPSSSFPQGQMDVPQTRALPREFKFPAQQLQSKQWATRHDVGPQIYQRLSLPSSPEWSTLLSIEPFDSTSWNEMILSAFDAPSPASASSQYPAFISSPYLLSCPPPSPSPSVSSSASASGSESSLASASSSNPASSRRTHTSNSPHLPQHAEPPPTAQGSGKTCSHCHATSTPLWRRDPATHRPLCNACGLYLQQRNKMRPAALIAADQPDSAAEFEFDDDSEGGGNGGGPQCSHCRTRRTSVWRRSKTGAKLCNACGVYARLRGRDRPLELRKNKIRPRCKHPKMLS